MFGPHAVELSGDEGPLSANGDHHSDHFYGVVKCPFALLELGIEIVDPFFPVLLEEAEIFAVGAFKHLERNIFPLGGFFLPAYFKKILDDVLEQGDLIVGPVGFDLSLGVAKALDLIDDAGDFYIFKNGLDLKVLLLGLIEVIYTICWRKSYC